MYRLVHIFLFIFLMFIVCWRWFVHFLMFVCPFCHEFQESREHLSPDHLRLHLLPLSKGLAVKALLIPSFVAMQIFSADFFWRQFMGCLWHWNLWHIPHHHKYFPWSSQILLPMVSVFLSHWQWPEQPPPAGINHCGCGLLEIFFAANTIWIFKALNIYVLFISSLQKISIYIFPQKLDIWRL